MPRSKEDTANKITLITAIVGAVATLIAAIFGVLPYLRGKSDSPPQKPPLLVGDNLSYPTKDQSSVKPPDDPTKTPLPPAQTNGEEIKNSIGMKLKRIPAGKFMMGSRNEERTPYRSKYPDTTWTDDPTREIEHEVEITKPFYLGVYEVTQLEYEKVTGKNPSAFSSQHLWKTKGIDTSNSPVEFISWEEASAFCDKLSQRLEERAAGRVYRLPTEAEWEYACRGNAREYTVFHFGNSINWKQANFKESEPYGTTNPQRVNRDHFGPEKGGEYTSNAFGLYDMHGNVFEWCADWFEKNYYLNSPKQDPKGPEKGECHVLRGGSFDSAGARCRSGYRCTLARPNTPSNRVGFRAACDQIPSGR